MSVRYCREIRPSIVGHRLNVFGKDRFKRGSRPATVLAHHVERQHLCGLRHASEAHPLVARVDVLSRVRLPQLGEASMNVSSADFVALMHFDALLVHSQCK